MQITIGSWNIWVYGTRDFKSIASFIKENNIDIIGIQEAAIYHDKNEPINSAEEIAKELNYQYVFYPSVDARPKKPWILGNAIISRFPIIESSFYNLNPDDQKYDGKAQTEQRTLIYSKIQLNENFLNFFTTHLQFSIGLNTTDVRIAQAEKIVSIVNQYNSSIILTGDFNSTSTNEEIKTIEKRLTKLGSNKPTWTVHPFNSHGWSVSELKYCIDNIFVSKDIQSNSFEVLKNNLSDHLPIKTTINI